VSRRKLQVEKKSGFLSIGIGFLSKSFFHPIEGTAVD